MRPIKLTSERAWRTYIGGSLLDSFHGREAGADTHFPEEWIMSTTAARNAGREHIQNEGMSRECDTGRTLKERIDESPALLLGQRHYEKYGANTGVLIKLIDSAERLSIQVHPNKEMARKLFDSEYGKTECWHILGGRTIDGEEPCIYLGFKEGITREKWKDVFDRQDIPAMLDCLHRIPVNEGDTFLIPGGVPHAIGSGCFLMEIQEPTDFTIRTERITPSGFQIADSMCHQGIGFEKMFDCFCYSGMNGEDNLNAYRMRPKRDGAGQILVGYHRTPCFQLTKYEVTSSVRLAGDPVFKGLYVLSGEGEFLCADGSMIKVSKGDQFFVPANTEMTIAVSSGSLCFAQLNGPQV